MSRASGLWFPLAALDDLQRPGESAADHRRAKAWMAGSCLPQGQSNSATLPDLDDATSHRHARTHGPRRATPALPHSRRARCATSSTSGRMLKPHGSRCSWNAATGVRRRWQRSCASIGEVGSHERDGSGQKEDCSQMRVGDRPPMMGAPASRRSPPRLPNLPPEPRSTRPRARPRYSATAVRLLAGIDLLPARFTLSRRGCAIAAADSSSTPASRRRLSGP